MCIRDSAWEELYIAEGSDWFWWFDENHSSSQDWLFDQLFRKHLQNVYLLTTEEPPAALSQPIGADRRQIRPFTQPTGLLSVKIDGRETYFEWLNAGVYTPSAARGTMTMTHAQRIEELYFGFDARRLLLTRRRTSIWLARRCQLTFQIPTEHIRRFLERQMYSSRS